MKTNMVYARADIHIAVVENLIYVIGGSSSSGPVNNTEVYDPVANTWSGRTAIPTARAGGAFATWNNNIYVFGGNTSSTGASPTMVVESFSAGKTYYLHCRN
jgi:N-acetylneuraminic acid mutarotase